MSEPTDQKIERDFNERTAEDRQDFISNTWCDTCQKENLGMHSPCEYELEGVIYIEGKCSQCDDLVITELTGDDF